MSPEARAAIGKRAGLSSGLLGMLCVLGELCFLLPDLLVSKEALPVYAANISTCAPSWERASLRP
jgi:hypothetical protein